MWDLFKIGPLGSASAKSVETTRLRNDQSRQAQIWLFGQRRTSRANERTERASFARRHSRVDTLSNSTTISKVFLNYIAIK